ncbi:MAG TPA: ABC transporter permease [Microbacteriaceae bacterium]
MTTTKNGSVIKRLLKSPKGATSLIILLGLLGMSLLVNFGIIGFDPISQRPEDRLLSPNSVYLLGTDQFGRDIFSRVMSGVGSSALISVVAVAIAAVFGTMLGLVGGFYRGVADLVGSGVTNILFAFPPLLLALTLASVLDRNWFTVAVAIGVVYIPIFARVTRGPVLSLREIEFVRAARSTGMNSVSIMLKHVLPNIYSIAIIQIALSLSWAVLTEAALSFLGLGSPPPAPSLGSMIYEARSLVIIAPWTLAAPGAVIVLFVVSLNLLGDSIRDILDPRSKEAR